MNTATLSDNLSTLSDDALFERLCNLSDNQKHHKACERDALAAAYNPLINAVCDEVRARGGNATEWLDAAEAI